MSNNSISDILNALSKLLRRSSPLSDEETEIGNDIPSGVTDSYYKVCDITSLCTPT
jgi:hypothetical protein